MAPPLLLLGHFSLLPTTIKTLMEKRMNKLQIARATGHDWKTVSKIIENIKKNDDF